MTGRACTLSSSDADDAQRPQQLLAANWPLLARQRFTFGFESKVYGPFVQALGSVGLFAPQDNNGVINASAKENTTKRTVRISSSSPENRSNPRDMVQRFLSPRKRDFFR